MIALIGNPNCGKSSLFNKLTNENQKIGNFPGVTVESKVGYIKDKALIDLPGIYSLSSYTNEENITINYIKNNKLSLIINVIDINCLNRSLYLTCQLQKLNIPMVIVLNKDDGYNKTKIDSLLLSKILNVDILNVSVLKNKGIKELTNIILQNKNYPKKVNFPSIENTEKTITKQYEIIDDITKRVIIKKKNPKINTLLDNILLNKYLSFIISLLLFLLTYYIAVNICGKYLIDVIDKFNNTLINYFIILLRNLRISIVFKGMIIDGLFQGISSILSFLPQMIIIMFIFSLLENLGYITRMSIIFDKPLRKIGLSGKSFVPLLLGTSCSALGVLATRTIVEESERLKTNLLIPFIPCSAKIPIILFVTSKFFNQSFSAFISFFIISIVIILFLSLFIKSKASNYVLEIPPLSLPNIKLIIRDTINKISSIITRLCSIVILFSLVNWFLSSFDFHLKYNVPIENSILYIIGDKISFLVKPFMRINDVSALLSIISGVFAKEQVVASISVLGANLNIYNAYSFVCFNLFFLPCLNTLVVLKKECGFKCLIKIIIIETLVAYLISIITLWVMIWIL